VKSWIRAHPAGFQALWLGFVWPPLMWLASAWLGFGFPHPHQVPLALLLWVLFGALIGGMAYGFFRLVHIRPGPPSA